MGIFDKFTKKKTEQKPSMGKKEPAVKVIKEKEEKPKIAEKVSKKEFSKAARPAGSRGLSFGAYRVLKSPHLTEKATNLASQNKYIFKVMPKANKVEIKKAIQDLYGVKVRDVNLINIPKKRRRLGKTEGFRPGYKKAVVTLAEGEKIETMA